MSKLLAGCLAALGLALAGAAAAIPIRVTDNAGRSVRLSAPARRVISLAPHLTELMFAAGAGSHVVGTVAYSNYPEAAKAIPRIGDSASLDLERIVELKPDLILIWQNGNAQRQLDKLTSLGIPVFYSQQDRLGQVSRSIEVLGRLAGTEAVAAVAAGAFVAREAELRRCYAARAAVRVFYQIWERPLMTINNEQIISDVIRLCGGRNVFGELKQLVPTVSTEDVIKADPEVIASGTGDLNVRGDLDHWKKWPSVLAVQRDNLFVIPSDLIDRFAPRILDGAQLLCEDFETARSRRPQ